MRLLIAVGITLGALLMFAGCKSQSIVPASSITIYRVSPEVPISSPSARGTVTLHVGDDYQILVKRLTNDSTGTHTSEVTTVCTYSFNNAGFATATSLGVIHAVAAGSTTLTVKFQPGAFDDIDRCYLDLIVLP
jgi:hypothetical protein